MRLSDLLAALPEDQGPLRMSRGADPDPLIRGITYDSRRVAAGDVFFALRGADVDGHEYLGQALDLGAAAVVVDQIPADLDMKGRTAAVVRNSRRALAPMAARFYGHPSQELTLVGITGTNGKTSVSYLVESILSHAGRRVGLIGTVEIRYAGVHESATNTTPESCDLQRSLRAMRTCGVDAAVMEVSSHGLELGRVEGCRFDVAAFTNLTQDHLDFHGSMSAYLESKVLLFGRYLARGGAAVINLDDASADEFLWAARRCEARVVGVSRDPRREAAVHLEDADVTLDGTRARVRTEAGCVDLVLPLVGDFNLENMLVAFGVGVALALDPDVLRAGIESCPQVPGRAERVGGDRADAPTIIIDYAHTPDAVDKLLRSLRPLTGGRLIALFGCGGDRDRSKRPLMAQAAARWSDRIIATSDNPRSEDPIRILADVEAGLTALQKVEPGSLDARGGSYAVIPDRRAAIGVAISIARPGDTVVIAGKGHEDYQIVGRERLPFSDSEEALRALAEGCGA